MEGFGGGGVVASAFGDVLVAGVFDGRDDGGQVGGAAAGAAGGGCLRWTSYPGRDGAPRQTNARRSGGPGLPGWPA